MKRTALIVFAAVAAAVVISACQTESAQQRFETRWAGEELEEIIASMEDQFGGFDQTMMETNYRYNELYWAGYDGNWGYAEYHLEKIVGSMERGFIRRPAREASASQFLNTNAPRLMETIEGEDRDAFLDYFSRFAASCNTCHEMEAVPFVQVIIPETRTSLVRF